MRPRVGQSARLAAAAGAAWAALATVRSWSLAMVQPGPGLRLAAKSAKDPSARHFAAVTEALSEVDFLRSMVDRQGLVPGFGIRADEVVKRALDKSVGDGGAGDPEARRAIEQVVDASLRTLFQRQLLTLRLLACDVYDEAVANRPNPLEAARQAELLFLDGAKALVRPGSGWGFEAERQDLLAWLARHEEGDDAVVVLKGQRAPGRHATVEVMRHLQNSYAKVEREAENRGALPWNFKWQYFLDNSPFGFRGQYQKGRAVVELLLLPSPDPRVQEKNFLHRLGPLNVAASFDLFLHH